MRTVFRNATELVADTGKSGKSVEVALQTSPSAKSTYGGEETTGSFPLLALSTEMNYAEDNSAQYRYVMLVASTDFANDSFLTSGYGNRRILSSAARMMSTQRNIPDIDYKKFEDDALTLDQETARNLTIFITVFAPLIIIVIGLVVYLRRETSVMLKKQYLISGVILLLAVALILVYFLFLREEAPVTETDPFFVLTDEAKAQVDTLRDDVRIVLLRSETEIAADALRTRMRSFLELYPQANDAVSLEYGSLSDWPDAPDADAIVFAGKAETVYVRYDDLYKKLENGTAYAFDGERLFTAALLKADGLDAAPADGWRCAPLDGYDTDGDTVGTGNRAFIYPNISRSDVQSIKIRNERQL